VREPGEGLDPQGHGLVAKLRSGDKAHAAGRALTGQIARPG
jgi:hypothetical protein